MKHLFTKSRFAVFLVITLGIFVFSKPATSKTISNKTLQNLLEVTSSNNDSVFVSDSVTEGENTDSVDYPDYPLGSIPSDYGSDSVDYPDYPLDSIPSDYDSDSVDYPEYPLDSIPSDYYSDSVDYPEYPLDSIPSDYGSDSVDYPDYPLDSIPSDYDSDSVNYPDYPLDSIPSDYDSDSVNYPEYPLDSIPYDYYPDSIDYPDYSVDSTNSPAEDSSAFSKPENKNCATVKELYPLPAREHLTIVVDSDIDCSVQITLIDIVGQVYHITSDSFLAEGENQLDIDLSSLRQGNYIYMISGKDIMLTGRIFIVN